MLHKKSDLMRYHAQAIELRSDFEYYWRKIIDYLLPGRNNFTLYSTPQKRRLLSNYIINNTGNDALQVFTSGLHGGLTSSARPWVKTKWKNEALNKVAPLAQWSNAVDKKYQELLINANFYEAMPLFYTELGGFGTGAIYLGETFEGEAPFHYEVLSTGEYCYSIGQNGEIKMFFRHITMSFLNVVEEFGEDAVSDTMKKAAESRPNDPTLVIQVIVKNRYQGKEYTSYYYEPTASSLGGNSNNENFLRVSGFNEMPVFICPWEPIGRDLYGTGLGLRALTEIMSLQEMERAYRMAVHQSVDPTLNAPAKMKGFVKSLPGHINWYSNPNDKITPLFETPLDLAAVAASIDRLETKIKRIFFNDLFITASRDPNASPLKAAEVYERRDEKLIRIGPSTEKLISRVLQPSVLRGINIAFRHKELPDIPPEFRELTKDGIQLMFVSPLAQSQKLVAVQSINNFLGFAGGVVQFYPEARDKVNGDRLMDEGADIFGVPQVILNSTDEVKQIRDTRAKQMEEAQKKQDMALQADMNAKQQTAASTSARNYADAGVSVTEALGEVSDRQRLI